jgi:hypothetical protein
MFNLQLQKKSYLKLIFFYLKIYLGNTIDNNIEL